ncbi:type VI secretion system membrane subunit TssM [uncultured Piscinibacter sp.]|uniref:type VI secretion system membrane subunit TssM n=1 Tax=uncultured Piscinibacter sp. TaxID=1131835 RepID=UPI002626BCC2|nr:type VI secretion system membrane subunit TssM [uncultured Piscinibacter sp.]
MSTNLPRLQTVANLAGAAALLWLAAPLIAWDGWRPFDSRTARLGLLAASALLLIGLWAAKRLLRQRRNARLLGQLGGNHPASDMLAQRFAHAMQLLRSGVAASGAQQARWWQPRRHLYQLPWYMFIGAPGAGKTTALLHAGLRFPLAERLGSVPVAGVGGTRQCDWWFTEQAVFIDTAGRYTTQDSNVSVDAQEWQTFLQLLRRYRPVQPINGVIVTVSVPDLLQGGADLELQAAAVDRRLQELRAQLGQRFPVYLLVTKADLLAGFVEFFGDFDAAQREQVWGVTFDAEARSATAPLPDDLRAQLAALTSRIAAMTPRRLQAEPLVQRRAAIYHFAAQLDALLPALEGFARQALRHAAEPPRQWVRGVYLSSGTQEGNPIDRVLGELSRSFGMALRAPARPAGSGKAYFLARLLQQLIIPEAALAGRNLQRRQRRRWLSAGLGGTVAALLLAACAGWIVSYRSNLQYVEAVRERVKKVAQEIDLARAADIDQLLPLYALLGQLAHSGAVDPGQASWRLDLGLFQGPRMAQSARQTYQRVLDRTLAPLLAERLTEAIRQEGNPAARYEALRVGLMLATPNRLQRGEVRRWAAQAFAGTSATGGQGPGAGEQQEWLRHLDALLERNAVLGLIRLDEASVRAARASLAGMSMEQRVHDRLMHRARERLAGDQTLADLASPAAVIAFAPQDAADSAVLPAAYTRQAWREVIEPAIEPTIAELAEEAGWVLGERSSANERLTRERSAREPLARQVARRHAQATAEQWDRLLATLVLQPPTDRDGLVRLGMRLAAADSPLRQLLRRIATEFPAAPPGGAASVATQAYDEALGAHFGGLRDYVQTSGGAAVDRLVEPLAGVLGEPTGARGAELARELRAEAGRAPLPLRAVWTGLADALAAQQRRAFEQQIGASLAELGQACRRLTADRFPFATDARRDMPFADFARLFGPSGLLDGFFRTRLAGQVDTRVRPWRPHGEVATSEKAQATVRSFEMADDIRRLFFPAQSELPQLRLQLTPAAMDGELLMFSADVDGQLLRYENGPRRPKTILWPGPGATQRVLMRILPAGPNGVGAEVHEGPWALLRVLQRGGVQRGGSAATSARLEVDGRALTVDLRAEGSSVPATLLGELGRFRCPEAW